MNNAKIAGSRERGDQEVIPASLLDANTIFHLNPSGRFTIGGPDGDAGLTVARSSSTPRRLGAPAAAPSPARTRPRWTAPPRTLPARRQVRRRRGPRQALHRPALLRHRRPEPLSVFVDTYGTGSIDEEILAAEADIALGLVGRDLDLKRSTSDVGKNNRYQQTAAYGYFGRDDYDVFTWENPSPSSDAVARGDALSRGGRRPSSRRRTYSRIGRY